MIAFACPKCGTKMNARDELAGKRGKCPKCQQGVAVPAAPGNVAVRSAGPFSATGDPPTLAAASASSLPGSGTRHGVADDDAALEQIEFLAPPQAPGELGRLGNYRVLEVLGKGGMGVVFRAEDPALKRTVALKAMLPRLAASGTAAKRFLREAQAMAAVKHDHIVTVYQVGEDRGVPFLAMEFLDGEPLDQRLRREQRLPVAEVIRIGLETAEGLEAAHERGLIHRDIKPANLWLEGKKRRVKILDFGLARSADPGQNLTQQGAIIGTPAFMAPEQATGTSDARSDLFSLGVVLYVLATGELPFKGNDTISTLMAVAMEIPPSPQVHCPDVPPALGQLIERLLAKKAADRPQTAREVVESLQSIAAQPVTAGSPFADTDVTIVSVPATARRRAAARAPIKPWLKWAVPAGLVVVALIIGLVLLLNRDRGPSGSTVASNKPATKGADKTSVGAKAVEIKKKDADKPVEKGKALDPEPEPAPPPPIAPPPKGSEPPANGEAPNQQEAAANRRAAELILQHVGGRLQVQTAFRGPTVNVTQKADLPVKPFWLIELSASHQMTDGDLKALDGPLLRALNSISISNSKQATGGGLAFLRACPNLVFLYLNNSGIDGTALRHVKPCQNLVALNVSRCMINDADLQIVAEFPRLSILNVAETHVTDAGLKTIGRITEMQILDLGRGITDDGLAQLGNLKRLHSLSSVNASVTGRGLASLEGLPLTNLRLGGDSLADDALKELAKLTQLRGLDLQMANISDAGLAHLKPLVNLQQLNLLQIPITDAGLEHLKGLQELRHLGFHQTKVVGRRLPFLKGLRNLTGLMIQGSPLSDAVIDDLKDLKTLRFLSIHQSKISPEGFEKLAAALPDCRINK